MQATSENARVVFVRELNHSTTKQGLIEYFSRFGEVVSVKMSLKKKDMKQNFAYVQFESLDSCQSCLESRHQILKKEGYRVEKMLEGNQLSERNDDLGNYRIYVGFIPKSLTEKHLYKIFQPFGRIEEAYINRQIHVVNSNVTSYFGFVTFTDPDVAQNLIELGNVEILPSIQKEIQVPDFRDLKHQEWKVSKPSLLAKPNSLNNALNNIPRKGLLLVKRFITNTNCLGQSKKPNRSDKRKAFKKSFEDYGYIHDSKNDTKHGKTDPPKSQLQRQDEHGSIQH